MLLEKVAERVSLGGRCKGKDQKARHLHAPPASGFGESKQGLT